MRNLTYSRTDVKGGKVLDLELPVPNLPVPEIKISDEDRDYQDLFVLAFPTPEGDDVSLPEPKILSEEVKEGSYLKRTYKFPSPVIVRSMEFPPPRQFNKAWAYDIRANVHVCAVYNNGSLRRRLLILQFQMDVGKIMCRLQFRVLKRSLKLNRQIHGR
jgi:hypothetical protein